jgi:thioredoxin 1
MVKQMVKHEFDVFVIRGKETCMIDFYADWCNPCKQLHVTLEQIDSRYAGRFPIHRINVDDEPEIAKGFGVKSIPTVIFFKNGSPYKTLVGNLSQKEYVDTIAELI